MVGKKKLCRLCLRPFRNVQEQRLLSANQIKQLKAIVADSDFRFIRRTKVCFNCSASIETIYSFISKIRKMELKLKNNSSLYEDFDISHHVLEQSKSKRFAQNSQLLQDKNVSNFEYVAEKEGEKRKSTNNTKYPNQKVLKVTSNLQAKCNSEEEKSHLSPVTIKQEPGNMQDLCTMQGNSGVCAATEFVSIKEEFNPFLMEEFDNNMQPPAVESELPFDISKVRIENSHSIQEPSFGNLISSMTAAGSSGVQHKSFLKKKQRKMSKFISPPNKINEYSRFNAMKSPKRILEFKRKYTKIPESSPIQFISKALTSNQPFEHDSEEESSEKLLVTTTKDMKQDYLGAPASTEFVCVKEELDPLLSECRDKLQSESSFDIEVSHQPSNTETILYPDDQGMKPLQQKVFSINSWNSEDVNPASLLQPKKKKFTTDCGFCNEPFQSIEKMLQHVREKHTKHRQFPCIDCYCSFITEDELKTHRNCTFTNCRTNCSCIRRIYQASRYKPVTINDPMFIIDANIPVAGGSIDHSDYCTPEAPPDWEKAENKFAVKCIFCGELYCSMEKLYGHIWSQHTQEHPFPCLQCFCSFQTETLLKVHHIGTQGNCKSTCNCIRRLNQRMLDGKAFSKRDPAFDLSSATSECKPISAETENIECKYLRQTGIPGDESGSECFCLACAVHLQRMQPVPHEETCVFVCGQCDLYFDSKVHLQSHMNRHNADHLQDHNYSINDVSNVT